MEMDNGIMGCTLVTLATHWPALDADVAVRASPSVLVWDSPRMLSEPNLQFPKKQIHLFESAFSGVFDTLLGEKPQNPTLLIGFKEHNSQHYIFLQSMPFLVSGKIH